MNLVNYLADRAEKHPGRIALIEQPGSNAVSISYVDLYAKVCDGAAQLKRLGLQSGDTVLILQPISIDLYISLLSVFHAGLTAMFIDPSAGKSMIRNSLALHPPQGFIGIAKAHLLRLTIPEIRNIPHHFHSSAWVPFSTKWRPQFAPLTSPSETTPETPALITFTSGSTGMPKAACRTHGFLLAQHAALAESLHYQEGEVDLITLPIFGLANLASGLTSVIADTDLRVPADATSENVYVQCGTHAVTRCAASPAFFAKLLADNRFPSFKAIYTGGAPVFPDLLKRIETAHPDLKIVTVFGSTEAEPIAHSFWHETPDADRKLMASGKGLLVGKAVEATQLRIIPDRNGELITPLTTTQFDDLELPVEEVGEIVVTGDHVLKGYLNGKGDEETKFKVDGNVWHRTGDAAWRDTQDRIWLVGRCSAAIHRDEQVIYPFGIECAAQLRPEITRSALIEHQSQVTLVVELAEPSTDKQALSIELLQQFPDVEQVTFVTAIPVDKRHNAKIDYPRLHSTLDE